jgi:hypothetical protein
VLTRSEGVWKVERFELSRGQGSGCHVAGSNSGWRTLESPAVVTAPPADIRARFRRPTMRTCPPFLPGSAPHNVPVRAGIEDAKTAFLTTPGLPECPRRGHCTGILHSSAAVGTLANGGDHRSGAGLPASDRRPGAWPTR